MSNKEIFSLPGLAKAPIPIPVGWKVIVKPKEGKMTTDGGIDVSATVDAQNHLVYLGTILAMGEAAFMTKTQGGLDLSKWDVRPQVGDNVIFSPYGGLRIHQRGEKWPIILLNDTDIHALVDDTDDYYAWLDV